MKKKPKESFVPGDRRETVRKEIISILREQALSSREVSGYVRVSEKEIYEHLNHIRKTIDRGVSKLIIHPARCKKCGFIFKKRERIKRPGKCPLCQGQSMEEPLFEIK